MGTSIFLEQSDTILQLAKLNKYLIELLARHTDVSADGKCSHQSFKKNLIYNGSQRQEQGQTSPA